MDTYDWWDLLLGLPFLFLEALEWKDWLAEFLPEAGLPDCGLTGLPLMGPLFSPFILSIYCSLYGATVRILLISQLVCEC